MPRSALSVGSPAPPGRWPGFYLPSGGETARLFRAHAGTPATLRAATSWYDGKDLTSATQQSLASRLGSGTLTLGSNAGAADTNDPRVLDYSTSVLQYAYVPGTSSNYLGVPDSAALSITGDLDVRVRANLVDWTPSAINTLVAKRGAAGNVSWQFRVSTSGAIELLWSADGTTALTATSTVATGITDGAWKWCRATIDVDNGAGGRSVTFYLSDDGSSWTQLGNVVTTATATSIFDSTIDLSVGAYNAGASNVATGRFQRVQLYNGIAGTKVLDIDMTTETLGVASWTCTTGQTVTVNKSTSGPVCAVVGRGRFMTDGTDDYLQLPAADIPTFTAAAGKYTVMMINRVANVQAGASTNRVFSSESAAANGLEIFLDSNNAQYKVTVGGAGSSATTAAAVFTANTQLHAVAAVVDTGTVAAYSTTTGLTATASIAGVGAITHANPRAGCRADSVANIAAFQPYVIVTWPGQALTAAELDSVAAYLLGSYV